MKNYVYYFDWFNFNLLCILIDFKLKTLCISLYSLYKSKYKQNRIENSINNNMLWQKYDAIPTTDYNHFSVANVKIKRNNLQIIICRNGLLHYAVICIVIL